MYQKSNITLIRQIIDWSVRIIFGSYIILSVVNMFTGIIAYVDSSGIHHGPLFMMNSIVPAVIFILLVIVMMTHREDYTKTQRFSIWLYFLMTFLFVGIELVTNNVAPLTMFGIAISLIVIQQSLVSPELRDLQSSLDEAKASRMLAQEAQLEAEEANKAKSSFLARMSHEIRTPLNAVIGFNSIISRETTDDSIRAFSNDAKMAGENLLSLINDILDFSKIESGKLELIEESYSFGQFVHEEYLLFLLKAQEKGLKLNFEVDESIPSGLYGDELRLKQIVTNLLSNGIKYTPQGSVTLSISLQKIEDNRAHIRFEIRDTGMGIKEEDLGKLFDAFERIEEKRNRKIEGTGLGVNICASLLAMMNSGLNVESEYGKGSCFSFVLVQNITDSAPVGAFEETVDTKAASEEVEQTDFGNAEILVVDDTPLNIKVIKGLLKKSGLSVDSANSGKSALEMALYKKYDLIFMDHVMPEMDGVEAMRLIKAQTEGKNCMTPIIALTANALKGAYEEYVSYGFDDALFKPVRIKELNEILNKYIGK